MVGSGHSALTAVIELARIAQANPGTRVTWALRRGVVGNTFGGGDGGRAAPARRARHPRQAGRRRRASSSVVDRVPHRADPADRRRASVLVSEDGRELPPADHVVVLTGFRPDLSFLSEMRLDLDPMLQAPVRMALEIDPNVHSCGTVGADRRARTWRTPSRACTWSG